MEVKVIALSCALLAICLSYLPMSDADELCTGVGVPANCIECSDPINTAHPLCVLSTLLPDSPDPTDPTPTPAPGGEATSGAPGGEATSASPGGEAPATGKKTRRKRKWKVVKKGGKTVIKRRRNQQKKWNFKG